MSRRCVAQTNDPSDQVGKTGQHLEFPPLFPGFVRDRPQSFAKALAQGVEGATHIGERCGGDGSLRT